MAQFACRTRDTSGNLVERTVEAPSRSAALKLLEDDGLFPVHVAPKDAGPAAAPRAAPALARNALDARVKKKELLRFSLQLASSFGAGVPLLAGLRSIAQQTTQPGFRAVIEGLARDVEGGLSLSAGMERYPRAFPRVYARTVAAGEHSGTLDVMLANLAEFLEAELEVQSDVRSALLYPAIVVSTLCLAISVLVFFVVPRFTEFYARFDTELPLPTRMLVGASHVVKEQGVWLALGASAAVAALVRLARTRAGRGWLDRNLLRVPVIGSVIETAVTLRAVQILGLSTQAGLPLLESLETIASTSGSPKMSAELRQVAHGVRAGGTLTASMEAAGCFPPSARQMLANGEATGTLERACQAVSKHYQKELRYLTKNLATFIEPLLTLVLAGVVLFVALAVFLPMWDLVKVVQR